VFADLSDDAGELKDTFSQGAASGLLICDHVRVPRVFQGRKYGPLLTASVIAELGVGRLTVTTPAAFQLLPKSPERAVGTRRNQRIAREFGFTQHSAEVWWLAGSPEVAYGNVEHYGELANAAEPITLP
jgi:hypothetical protein